MIFALRSADDRMQRYARRGLASLMRWKKEGYARVYIVRVIITVNAVFYGPTPASIFKFS